MRRKCKVNDRRRDVEFQKCGCKVHEKQLGKEKSKSENQRVREIDRKWKRLLGIQRLYVVRWLVAVYICTYMHRATASHLVSPIYCTYTIMKETSEVEEKPFTSSLNIYHEACSRKGQGRVDQCLLPSLGSEQEQGCRTGPPEPVYVNVKGTQESIPRKAIPKGWKSIPGLLKRFTNPSSGDIGRQNDSLEI